MSEPDESSLHTLYATIIVAESKTIVALKFNRAPPRTKLEELDFALLIYIDAGMLGSTASPAFRLTAIDDSFGILVDPSVNILSIELAMLAIAQDIKMPLTIKIAYP